MMSLYWEESTSLVQSAGMYRHVCRQINELFLCCLPLKPFITEFYFDRLPQMAAIKEIVQLLPISSISWPSLFRFGFDLKHSQGTKPIPRNGSTRTG